MSSDDIVQKNLRSKMIALMDSSRGIQSRLSSSIGKKSSFFSEIRRGKPVNTLHLMAVGKVFGGDVLLDIMSVDNKTVGIFSDPMTLGLTKSVQLLAKIYESDDQVLISAIESTLVAISRAAGDRQLIADQSAGIKRLENECQTLRRRIENLERQIATHLCSISPEPAPNAADTG